MKKLVFAIGLICCSVIVKAQSNERDSVLLFSYFNNNGEDGLHLAWSEDGLSWKALNGDSSFLKPTAGDDKLMRDPCVIKGVDGLFHMVWTVSWKEKAIGYASSKDLIHWSKQQTIPVMAHEQDALNCWAPEIIYDAASKQYMIYWATTIPGRFKEGEANGDDKYNHRIYYSLTKDFKHYTKAAVLYNKGFNVIDATIKQDGSRYIMFLKDETLKPVAQKNIRVAVSDHLTYGYSEPSAKITGDYWAEGPTGIKLNGKWIVYFDKYMQHTYGAVTSADLKNWEDISDRLKLPKGTKHGTVLKISKTELSVLMNK